MKKVWRSSLRRAAMILAWFVLGVLRAPGGTTGIIEGVVLDKKTGEPLPGVNVRCAVLSVGTVTNTEGMFALTCSNREEVDALVKQAFAAGATPAMDPQDHGFMYGWSFYDLDGHHWEAFWMDPKVVE